MHRYHMKPRAVTGRLWRGCNVNCGATVLTAKRSGINGRKTSCEAWTTTSTIDLYTLSRTAMSLNNMINKIKDKATGHSQNENQNQAPTGGQEQDRGQEQKFNILPHPAVRRTTLASAYTDLSAIVISIPSESCWLVSFNRLRAYTENKWSCRSHSERQATNVLR